MASCLSHEAIFVFMTIKFEQFIQGKWQPRSSNKYLTVGFPIRIKAEPKIKIYKQLKNRGLSSLSSEKSKACHIVDSSGVFRKAGKDSNFPSFLFSPDVLSPPSAINKSQDYTQTGI